MKKLSFLTNHMVLYMKNHMYINMKRKLRLIGGCLILTIPKQIADLYKFKAGDEIEIEPIGINELKIKKI